MKNLNNIFETSDDVRSMYKAKIKYWKLFRAVMILIGLIGIIYIAMAVYYLEVWNSKQLKSWQYTETFIAQINGQDTVIHTRPDGTREARIVFEYCCPLKFIDDCRNENEIIGITF